MNSPYKKIKKRYRQYAAHYDQRWAEYSAATLAQTEGVFRENLADSSATVLDVGCGTGLFAQRLRPDYPNLVFTGLDVTEDMIAKAKSKFSDDPKTQWHVGMAEKLPFSGEKFEFVTCTSSFHLIQNQSQALAEFNRVLKPEGFLLITDWCRDFLSMRLFEKFLIFYNCQKRSIRHLDELIVDVERSGFKVQNSFRFRAKPAWGLFLLLAQKSLSI